MGKALTPPPPPVATPPATHEEEDDLNQSFLTINQWWDTPSSNQTSSSGASVTQEQPQHAGDEALSTPWSDRLRCWCRVNRGKEVDDEHLSLSPVSSISSWGDASFPLLMSIETAIPPYDSWTLNGMPRIPKVLSPKARFYYTPGLTG